MSQPQNSFASMGARRAAILLLSLGEEVSIGLMQHLSGEELRSISEAARELNTVTPEEIELVLNDFSSSLSGPFVGPGGDAYLRSLAVRALGEERAELLLGPQPEPPADPDPLQDCVDLSPSALATLLEREHPQVSAMVLASIETDSAGKVLSHFSDEGRVEVVRRIGRLEQVKPELLREIGEALLGEVRAMVAGGANRVDGPVTAANLVKLVGANEELVAAIEASDAELAADIRKQLFTFSDVAALDNRAIQQILREIDSNTLVLALKSAPDSARESVLSNMSSRAAEMILEELESMGPVRIADVEGAHEAIVAVALRLADEGSITIAAGDDLV